MWDGVLGVILKPKLTMRSFSEKGVPLSWGFWVFVMTSVITTLSGLPSITEVFRQFGLGDVTNVFAGTVGFLGIIFSLLSWFMSASVIHMTASLFDTTPKIQDAESPGDPTISQVPKINSAKNFLAMLAFCRIPQVFSAPLSVLSRLSGAIILTTLLGLLITIWTVVLIVIAVSENYSFSGGKATLIVLLPAAIFAAVTIVFAVAFGLFLAPVG
jgi:hypothetical protein